jgi:sulfatase modifying factor 1
MFWGGPITALPAEPPADEELQRITSLLKQLEDRHFAARVSAVKQLIECGERVLPVVRQVAAASDNAELRYRAKYIIRRIIVASSTSKSTGLETVIIDAGEFLMGSSLKEPGHRVDEIPHLVQISQPFLLGKHEVTQRQFQQVMAFTPSHFMSTGDGKTKVLKLDTSEFPVERVSWFDAVVFCNKLSKKDGYRPYYKMMDVQHDGNSIKQAVLTIEGGNGYRLPTEAEWEYACRASSTQRFHFGSSSNNKKANFVARGPSFYGSRSKEKSMGRTAKVGSYPPNNWGLYDMHGNVAEWCWDWYAKDYYTHSLPKNPPGPASGQHRVVRGGSWLLNEASCRSASRFYLTGDQRKYFAGFRVARTP